MGKLELIVEKPWALVKRGYYYRPDALGYTGYKAEAGRYSDQEADDHIADSDGVTAVLFEELPEISPSVGEYERTKYQIDLLVAALQPFADTIFNDNGDITVDTSIVTNEDFIKAYFTLKKKWRNDLKATL